MNAQQYDEKFKSRASRKFHTLSYGALALMVAAAAVLAVQSYGGPSAATDPEHTTYLDGVGDVPGADRDSETNSLELNPGKHSGLLMLGLVTLLILVSLLMLFPLFNRRCYKVIKVEASAKIIGDDRVRRKSEYVFSIEGFGKVSYRIGKGGEWRSPLPHKSGEYLIPKGEITGHLTVECR